jgi:hypothetical protein
VAIMPTRRATSFRLTTQALRLLARLAARSGISQAACLELAIGDLAMPRARGLKSRDDALDPKVSACGNGTCDLMEPPALPPD